ncbi:MAG: hypothetical protein V4754_02675 [Pseudomonadota bacterium]
MSRLKIIDARSRKFGIAAVAILTLGAILLYTHVSRGEPEIALVIGEPYEAMRQRSSAVIDPAIPNEIWYNIPKSDARLRFIDPQYEFVTPLARFFTVSYVKGVVNTVRMSPQIEPMLLGDTLRVVVDLQDQWRKNGWRLILEEDNPPFADTPFWRARLENCRSDTVYWQAADKYQILLAVDCFDDDKHPGQKRYMITLALAEPWLK